MIDKIIINVEGGDGGSGVVSFRHEKYVPFGGPDGGDGGRGGNVCIAASKAISTLRRFKRRQYFKAERGRDGSGGKKHGREGKDIIIKVPLGTIVWCEAGGKKLLADLRQDEQIVVVAKGGEGGCGNAHFASSINQAPPICQRGEPGEKRTLILELKLIADVGIIGYPNVGKSTLLVAASGAKPKIADYAFTTLEPILGVVNVGWGSFTIAEIPGLVEGAHSGRGLGHEFLRHIERTKLLIHLLDGSSQDPLRNLEKVNEELGLYHSDLLRKPQIVVVNKIDLSPVKARLPEFEKWLSPAGVPYFFISAATGEGVPEVMARVVEMLEVEKVDEMAPEFVFRPKPKWDVVRVEKANGVFVVSAPHLKRLAINIDPNGAEGRRYLKRQLERLGVAKALKKAGVKVGDRVKVEEVELEWE
jgi:GTP-binding protein